MGEIWDMPKSGHGFESQFYFFTTGFGYMSHTPNLSLPGKMGTIVMIVYPAPDMVNSTLMVAAKDMVEANQ